MVLAFFCGGVSDLPPGEMVEEKREPILSPVG